MACDSFGLYVEIHSLQDTLSARVIAALVGRKPPLSTHHSGRQVERRLARL